MLGAANRFYFEGLGEIQRRRVDMLAVSASAFSSDATSLAREAHSLGVACRDVCGRRANWSGADTLRVFICDPWSRVEMTAVSS